jgi:hypothetical protein
VSDNDEAPAERAIAIEIDGVILFRATLHCDDCDAENQLLLERREHLNMLMQAVSGIPACDVCSSPRTRVIPGWRYS